VDAGNGELAGEDTDDDEVDPIGSAGAGDSGEPGRSAAGDCGWPPEGEEVSTCGAGTAGR
jgi:hypothetical protein